MKVINQKVLSSKATSYPLSMKFYLDYSSACNACVGFSTPSLSEARAWLRRRNDFLYARSTPGGISLVPHLNGWTRSGLPMRLRSFREVKEIAYRTYQIGQFRPQQTQTEVIHLKLLLPLQIYSQVRAFCIPLCHIHHDCIPSGRQTATFLQSTQNRTKLIFTHHL
jgi:hypothetical protein